MGLPAVSGFLCHAIGSPRIIGYICRCPRIVLYRRKNRIGLFAALICDGLL